MQSFAVWPDRLGRGRVFFVLKVLIEAAFSDLGLLDNVGDRGAVIVVSGKFCDRTVHNSLPLGIRQVEKRRVWHGENGRPLM